MLIYPPGTRLRLLHTGEPATALSWIDAETLEVALEDGLEIPVFLDDVIREEDYAAYVAHQASLEPAWEDPADPVAEKPSFQPGNSGILLGFEPIRNREGGILHFEIFLANDLMEEVMVLLTLHWRDRSREAMRFLSPGYWDQAGQISLDELHEVPECELTADNGRQALLKASWKIRTGPFLKRQMRLDWKQQEVYLYTLEQGVGLEEGTRQDIRQHARHAVKRDSASASRRSSHVPSPLERAAFQPVIDLHIEKLHPDPATLDATAMLHLQLMELERFLAKAYRLGLEKVTVIHGLGKGTLRNMIHDRLDKHEFVREYANRYSPGFGWGATEIWF